ncbi:hypothetical protein CONLIGDRAFT_630433 [Coniochaeta ligniaria NRRL 30616]|uniref:Uncharacterized protein n=1 Tax=Coniochaeta ligniaria NRRL 30616 TaxID=1408157 RepID=A0A1J7JM95_9PEZI|nr:hypothetical protein CONLIGDRAFT_630433 [Coniochaeta ligniaria NRRL 30616]
MSPISSSQPSISSASSSSHSSSASLPQTTTDSSRHSPTASPQTATSSTTSHSVAPPPSPTSTAQPAPTATCTLDMPENYVKGTGGDGDVTVSIYWTLGKSDTANLWSASNIPLQWTQETILDVPADAKLAVPLGVTPMQDSPTWTVKFRYGNLMWTSEDRKNGGGPAYSVIVQGNGGCVSKTQCDRRIVSTFPC